MGGSSLPGLCICIHPQNKLASMGVKNHNNFWLCQDGHLLFLVVSRHVQPQLWPQGVAGVWLTCFPE